MTCTRTSRQPKALSLVFSISEELPLHDHLGGPEPTFEKWVEDALYFDIATAADEAEWEKLPAEERQAWRLFHDAIEATSNLLTLHKEDPKLFQKVASQLSL